MTTLIALPNVSCPEPTYCTVTTPPGCPCFLPMPSAQPAPVPTLAGWAVIVTIAALVIVGSWRLR